MGHFYTGSKSSHHVKNDNRFPQNKKYHTHKTEEQVFSICFSCRIDNIPDILTTKNQIHGKTKNDSQK